MYIYQLLIWLIIVLFAKIFLAILQYNINEWLEVIGSAILFPFRNNGKLKLVVVMVIFPVLMNSIQFWVTDNFLKHKKEVYPQLELPRNNQLKYENAEINIDDEHKGGKSVDQIDSLVRGKDKNEIRIDFDFENENSKKESKENIKEYINLKLSQQNKQNNNSNKNKY
jgi:hypothetical protein